jgi:hypothetical protein
MTMEGDGIPKTLKGLKKHGTCSVKCKLNNDVVYPKEEL